MDKNLPKRITELENQVKALQGLILKLPLSPAAIGALNQAFINSNFDKFEVRRLLLSTGQAVNPTKEGEIVYHSTTPSLKIMLNGAVKTITVS